MDFKNLVSNLKDLADKIKVAIPEKWDKKYTIFVSAFFFSVLLKLALFTLKVNGSLYFSSGLDDSPVLNFLMSYSIYAGVALLFVALGAFSKYFWPAFALDLILDIWILADLISLRAHGIMITGYDFRIVSNMDGFWDSLFAFIKFSDLLLFISTGAFIYIYIKFFKPFHRRWITGLILLIISIPLLIMKPIRFNKLWGMPVNIFDQMNITGEGREIFSTDYTIFLDLISEVRFCNSLDDIPKHVELTNEEKEEINAFMIKPEKKDTSLRDNMMILFVESMEGWTLNNSINGQEITPNFNALAKRNALYGEKMCPQTQRGSSSDAQLLVNTGLMPLIYEATCFAYENNFYYSIGDAMMRQGSKNVMMIPTKPSAWNQSRISKPWGFPTLHGQDYSDKELFEDLARTFDSLPEPFCLEAVTMASHAPFWKYAGFSELDIPAGLPPLKEYYIKSLNYTDKCFGEFIEKIKDSPKFANTTFVIVGDHCVFSDREEFDQSEIGRTLNANRGFFVPFVISSPNNIAKSKEITDTTYQCDIYPTLLSLFKLDNYPWRGFGCDMTKKIERNNVIESGRANGISERIIKNDYFRTLEESETQK